MGWRFFKSRPINVKKHDDVEMEVVLDKEADSVIHGIVETTSSCDKFKPVKNAHVKLSEKHHCSFLPIQKTFTDECGQFIFFVEGCKEYLIEVFAYDNRQTDHHSHDKKYIDDSMPKLSKKRR